MIQFFRTQIGPQGGRDLRSQGSEYGLLLRCAQLSKYHSQRGVFLVPAGDVGLSDRGEDGGNNPASDVVPVSVLKRFSWIEHHQQKELPRAFGSLSVQAKRAKEHRLGQESVRLNRGAVPHGRVLETFGQQKLHRRQTHGLGVLLTGEQVRCHLIEFPRFSGISLSIRQLKAAVSRRTS